MYKEKYLKYKTKYLDLKSQIGSHPNIIQEGGGGSWSWGLWGKSQKDKLQPQSVVEHKDEPEDDIKIPPPTIQSAIETLTNQNMMTPAIYMEMNDYRTRRANGEPRIPWSLDKKIVTKWNSAYANINNGVININNIISNRNYKIDIFNLGVNNKDTATILIPYGSLKYNEYNEGAQTYTKIDYFMDSRTGEIQQSYGA
jgi:hypothetical protein